MHNYFKKYIKYYLINPNILNSVPIKKINLIKSLDFLLISKIKTIFMKGNYTIAHLSYIFKK